MTHSHPITRLNPTAFIVLIDLSGSMTEKIIFGGIEMTKARAVTHATSSFIDELLFRARRESGTYDYYDIAVLGYSGDGVESLISPPGEFTSPSVLAASGARREKIVRERKMPMGRSAMTVNIQNVWIDEKASGSTPMCQALNEGLSLVEAWCKRRKNSESYPPTVINITDGEASDCNTDNVRAIASRIRATGTSDGNTLLINIHLASGGDGRPVMFPSSPDELPDHRYARMLWDISSEMPESYHDVITFMRPDATAPFRGVAWCSQIGELITMMNIGSVNSLMI
jgi:hypothetical protein